MDQLLRAGIEVAEPSRDRGIDLIAYVDQRSASPRFVARPIQMKAASDRAWSIDRKYADLPDLIIAYVWCVTTPDASVCYAMTYSEAVTIAEQMGYAATASWTDGGYYMTSSPSQRLMDCLEPHRMTAERWRRLFQHPA